MAAKLGLIMRINKSKKGIDQEEIKEEQEEEEKKAEDSSDSDSSKCSEEVKSEKPVPIEALPEPSSNDLAARIKSY